MPFRTVLYLHRGGMDGGSCVRRIPRQRMVETSALDRAAGLIVTTEAEGQLAKPGAVLADDSGPPAHAAQADTGRGGMLRFWHGSIPSKDGSLHRTQGP